MATYYVSNAAVNGYDLGVNTNNGTAKSGTAPTGPFLTIAQAITTSTTGDTIIVNPSGSPYVEGAASSFASINKSVTIQTDPALVGTQGKFAWRSNAGNRILNIQANNITLNNIIFDGAGSAAGANGVTVQGNTGLSVTNCDFKAFSTASGNAFNFGIANASATIDKVTCTLANTNSTVNFINMAAAGLSIIVKGCTVDHTNAFIIPNGNNNQTLIQVLASGDGTRNTVSNSVYGVRLPGATVTTLDVEAVDFSTISNPAIWDNNLTTCIVSSCTVTNCTCAGAAAFVTTNGTWSGSVYGNTTTTTGRFFQSNGVGLNNMLIHDNTITQSGSSGEPIYIIEAGSGIKVYNNTITTDNTAHVIQIGNDGQTSSRITNTSATTTISLGNTSADTYYYQPFITTASTVTPNYQMPSSAWFSLRTQGSPTGTVTCYLYSDSAGLPGTLLDTSDFTLSTANLTASSQYVEFWFPNHPTLSYSTKYHAVLKYTGTNDNTNYVLIDANAATGTTFANGGYSSNGSSWGTAGSNAAIFNICYLPLEITDPEIYGNTINLNVGSTNITHCCFMGGTTGGKIYKNVVYQGALSLIFKLCNGSSSHPLLCYDNLVYATCGSSGSMYDKGSRNAQFYHNTIINASQNGAAACILANDFTTGNYNAQASQNAIVKNNIIYRSASSGGPVYLIGNSNEAQPTVISPTIDYNCVYVGNNSSIAYDYRSGSFVTVADFASWQALGFDLNGQNLDPKLPSPLDATNKWYVPTTTAHFKPNRVSPAYAMGTPLSATIPADYAGSSFSTSHPCVGAYTFIGKFRQNSGLVGGVGGSLGAGL